MSIQPEGNNLKRAIKWISEQKIAESSKSAHLLIEEASLKFNLDPQKTEYLLRTV